MAVVFWSGTGNTAAMAEAVAEGGREAGAEVAVLTAAEFSADQVKDFDRIAFGCPAMGAEVLEEGEFDPMFTECRVFSPARRLRSLAPTAGEPANGWNPGRTGAMEPEQFLRRAV